MLRLRRYWPEIVLALVTIFFTFRELTTFPASWEDSALYSMVARSIATGHGYTLHILGHHWPYPYFLSVGPAVIYPVAFFIHFFDIGRIAMALYLLGSCVLFYVYTQKATGRRDARWATALLITLSAFVNTGKPVLGSVPAFFYVLAALLFLHESNRSWRNAMLAGLALGLSLFCKLTFLLVIPALGIAAFLERKRSPMKYSVLTAGLAAALFIPWLLVEVHSHGGLTAFVIEVFTRADDGSMVGSIFSKWTFLFRFQYAYFLVIFGLGLLGLWCTDTRLTRFEKMFVTSLILLFFGHFLVREGWYRHLLSAHLFLIPFVPRGARKILPRWWMPLLGFFIVAQFLWQLDHRGSSRSPGGREAATYIQTHLTETDILIRSAEVFARLPDNPHWLYYPLPGTGELIPEDLLVMTDAQKCFPRVQKGITEGTDAAKAQVLGLGYYLVPSPEKNCPHTSLPQVPTVLP